ncbi:uncharacterized protein LOC122370505 [Amphibalanus amphitrite]|uniref:uncharacterized protein LOC122370505 n=1 Tax=Amphibalanus amphitrite TaxID=1232801 RepID=UPI001C92B1E4|nr:uncharacterized protein LOC122370505 [Amphibalanus amphitrite]
MDEDAPPTLFGSSPRLDCLLDIWDSLVLRSRACRAEELRTEPAAGPERVVQSDTSRGAELCAGDVSAAPGSPGSRLDSPRRGGSSSQCGDPRTPAVDSVVSTASVQISALPGDARRGLSVRENTRTVRLPSVPTAAPTCSEVSAVAASMAIGDADRADWEISVTATARVTRRPASLAVPLSEPLSQPSCSPCCQSRCSPSSELGSTHPSKTLASPLSTLSAPTTDSGICETPSEEACSSFELSITGESSLSAGGDSTGDEAARGLSERPRPAAGRERRAPRWRTAELRQRPLSVVSTASSSSSSGGGSLPRSLVRRRPARGAARDVTDSAGNPLAVGGGGGLARTQSLQLDGCVTQADRVVAEILHTEAAYVSDLREVLEVSHHSAVTRRSLTGHRGVTNGSPMGHLGH